MGNKDSVDSCGQTISHFVMQQKGERRMRQWLFALLIALLLLIRPGEGEASRAIPDDNLAYPVLVTLDNGATGSAFFLNTRTGIHLVTAAHVLYNDATGDLRAKKATLLSYSKNPQENGKNVIQLDLSTLLSEKRIRRHSTEDIAVVHIADAVDGAEKKTLRLVSAASGVSIDEMTPSGILGIGIEGVKRFEEVLTANTVYVFGYPTSLGIKDLPQIDPLRPLLRFGIIAGTNPARKTIILDCPSYPGNSGGPVLEVEEENFSSRRFRLIGIVSQFVPFTETWVNVTHHYKNLTVSNSGYAIAVSMDPLLELIPP